MINEVEKLRGLAKQHREAATALDQAADVIEQMGSTLNGDPIFESAAPKRRRISRKSKVDEMKKLVILNGPMKRKEFFDHGIANSTVQFVLSDPENGFFKTDDKRWTLRDTELPVIDEGTVE